MEESPVTSLPSLGAEGQHSSAERTLRQTGGMDALAALATYLSALPSLDHCCTDTHNILEMGYGWRGGWLDRYPRAPEVSLARSWKSFLAVSEIVLERSSCN